MDVQTTNDVSASKSYESGSRIVIDVERQSQVTCSDGSYLASVDGVSISVSGSWKRIAYKQTFLETKKCFAIFRGVPDW